MNTTAAPPIALIGLMGAGKTEVARRIAGALGLQVRDLDAELETEGGVSIATWFRERGEASFRERERELVERALAGGRAVIACGGGAVLDPRSRAALAEKSLVVWLEVSPREAARRLAGVAASRPLLSGGDLEPRLRELLDQRAAHYAALARWRVSTDGRTAGQVADEVLARLGGERPA